MQAVRAQIQGLMVPHVLLPLHTNIVTWSLMPRTSRIAGWSTAVGPKAEMDTYHITSKDAAARMLARVFSNKPGFSPNKKY